MTTTLIIVLIALVALVVQAVVLSQFIVIPRPHEAVILSGGSASPYRIIKGRRMGFRKPIIERQDTISLELMHVSVSVKGAYSKGNIPLNIKAVAAVSVDESETIIRNAVERFLGRSSEEIGRVAKETLEGHLRSVTATLKPEALGEQGVASTIMLEAEDDFAKLGLRLHSLGILEITDEVDFLASQGRAHIEKIRAQAQAARGDV